MYGQSNVLLLGASAHAGRETGDGPAVGTPTVVMDALGLAGGMEVEIRVAKDGAFELGRAEDPGEVSGADSQVPRKDASATLADCAWF